MSEGDKTIDTPLRVVRREWVCPQCQKGTMQRPRNGIVYDCYPPLYPHQCEACGHEQNSHTSYPSIEYV